MNPDGIRTYRAPDGSKVIEVDRNTAMHNGKKVRDFTAFEKKRFDNVVYLKAVEKDRVPTKIVYKGL